MAENEMSETDRAVKAMGLEDKLLIFGKSFAFGLTYWKTELTDAVCIGALMGLLGLAFFNGFEFMINSWLGSWNSEHEHVGPGGSAYLDGITNGEAPAMMGTGKWWWLGVTTGGGFLVGALKLFKPLNFPKEIHGLFLEATELHVDPYTAPALVLLSMISLGVGATVGPEMAMGTLGGAVGAFVSIKRGYNEEQRHMATLTGMAAGMGSLVPSPPVACLMLWELTAVGEQPPHHFMQNIVNTGVAATAAYFVFDIVGPYTFVEIESSSIALYDVMNFAFNGYKQEWMGEAVILGVISGVIGFLSLFTTMICKVVFRQIQNRIDEKRGGDPSLGTFLMPGIGGLLFGLIGVAFPLTFGDGSMQIGYIISATDELGSGYTLATMFMKMLSLGICQATGFIGGSIFPCIFMGACAGMVATDWTGIPFVVTAPCMMAAVPSAYVPLPFTMMMMVSISLSVGPQITGLIFISSLVSFMTICGSGVMQGLIKKLAVAGYRKQQAKEQAKQAKEAAVTGVVAENKIHP